MAYFNQQLKTAIVNKDESTIEQLLECGANPNAFLAEEDIAPIHLGSGMSKSITCLLLKYGGDPNLRTSDGITPLHIAAIWGNKSIVKLLLHNGANIYICDNEGFTPLDMAKKYEHEKCEIILKQHLHILESQMNNQKQEIKQKPPLNTKTETNFKRVIDNNRNVDANQNLSVDLKYWSLRIKQKIPKHSVLYRKEIQNQINHLCENEEDFHLDVTSPDHPRIIVMHKIEQLQNRTEIQNQINHLCENEEDFHLNVISPDHPCIIVTPKKQCHFSSPKHIHTYSEPVTENTSTPIRPRQSLFTTSMQHKIDSFTDSEENVGIDVTSPDHPELFLIPTAKSPLNYLGDSTDESVSWSEKDKKHSPLAFSSTSTSACEEITSKSMPSDEFKRYLERKELLTSEEKTTLWVNEYFDDMSSILPELNSSTSSSDISIDIKYGTTAANVAGHHYIELENLSEFFEKYTPSVAPGIRTDFLETCSSKSTFASMQRLVLFSCEDSNEDKDVDEVDHGESSTYVVNYCGNQEFGKDNSQPISTETKIYGETYKTKLAQGDKRRKSNNIEFLHTDPEERVQFIERQISAENQNGDQSDDSESTEIYDWKSFSKSFNDCDNLPQTENRSFYWRMCEDKNFDVKTNVRKSKKPLIDLGCLSDEQVKQTLIDHGLSQSISTKCQY